MYSLCSHCSCLSYRWSLCLQLLCVLDRLLHDIVVSDGVIFLNFGVKDIKTHAIFSIVEGGVGLPFSFVSLHGFACCFSVSVDFLLVLPLGALLLVGLLNYKVGLLIEARDQQDHQQHLVLRKPPPATEPSRALQARNPKRVKKGPPVPGVHKVLKEPETSQQRVKNDPFWLFSDSFRTFWTPGTGGPLRWQYKQHQATTARRTTQAKQSCPLPSGWTPASQGAYA